MCVRLEVPTPVNGLDLWLTVVITWSMIALSLQAVKKIFRSKSSNRYWWDPLCLLNVRQWHGSNLLPFFCHSLFCTQLWITLSLPSLVAVLVPRHVSFTAPTLVEPSSWCSLSPLCSLPNRDQPFSYISHHHQSFSQLCWGRLHEFCFFILIYPKPNPRISFTSSSLFLLPSTSSLAYPFPLVSHQPA